MKIFRKFMIWLIALFLSTSILSVIVYKFVPVSVTPLMIKRAAQTGNWDWQHQWVPLNEIAGWLPKAVVAVEDGRFYEHHGVDWDAVERAMEENKTRGRARGGSGITQQTVKNVFLWEGSNNITKALRKPFEVYFAYLADFIWGKERVMEIYLNSIEMGPSVYGAQAAAEYYWKKSAMKLTKMQCVLIACSLKNPIRFNPASPNSSMRRQAARVMKWI